MKHILYIEDDQALRQLVEFIIKTREDLALTEAENGLTGLQLAVEKQPDIILLDLSLPDISGFEVLQKLQSNEATNNIPVIAVSGDNLSEDIQKGLDAGFQGYLTKPIMVADFFDILEKNITAPQ